MAYVQHKHDTDKEKVEENLTHRHSASYRAFSSLDLREIPVSKLQAKNKFSQEFLSDVVIAMKNLTDIYSKKLKARSQKGI